MPKRSRDEETLDIRGESSPAVEERKGILLLIQRDYDFLLFREAENELSFDDPWWTDKTDCERSHAGPNDADYPLRPRRITAPYTLQEKRVWRTAVLSRSLDPEVYTIDDMLFVRFFDRFGYSKVDPRPHVHVAREKAGLAAPPPEERDSIKIIN